MENNCNYNLIAKIKLKIAEITPLIILLIKIKQFLNKNKQLIHKNTTNKKIYIENKMENPKSCVIIATHFVNGNINNSTIYYLKELKKIFEMVILTSDNLPLDNKINKIRPLVDYAFFEEHNEYDFGSYKRGVNFIYKKNLNKSLNHLLLCNDSVYGPIFDLNNLINQMNSNNFDFWGMISSKDIRKHLQSWFLYFNKSVIDSNYLHEFLNKVKEEKNVWNVIIKYETKLTKFLYKKGFHYKSFIPDEIPELIDKQIIAGSSNKTLFPLFLMKNYKIPFVKKKFFNGRYDKFKTESKEEVLNYIKLINKYIYEIIISE